MNKGIYIALSGAVLKRRNMDLFGQNIANANTPGYKKERVAFKDYIVPADNKVDVNDSGRVMADLSKSVIDFSSGTIQRTGNGLDLAINGEGFFTLEGGRYTRNGNFMISSDGYLATSNGVKVLGDGGPIAVQGSSIDISTSGDVLVDGVLVGKVKIVNFRDTGVLKKLSGGMFATDEAGEEVNAQVSQGFLEQSNVNAIQEMVQMLASTREFESYQKIIHSFDEAASKTINELGK
ncbi:MAG: flagellar basal-body rod protein FlgF [Nitrospiraceae bacterium]|nr:MAG: flagellar basal-body rod protein FlgF [Nitrospiraceae bacterium]